MIRGYILIGAGLVIGLLIFFNATNFFGPKEDRDLSAVCSYLYSAPEVKTWLNDPKKAYVQAYFSFPQSLAEDVAFAVDIEFWDGEDTPKYLQSGVWMAYMSITRTGNLSFYSGDEENFNGNPGKGELIKIPMNASLNPDTWYKLRSEADFAQRKFLNFTLEGPNVNKTIDLSQYNVIFPEVAPVTQRIIFLSVGALKLHDAEGTNIVYVDDVEAGIEVEGRYLVVFQDGFEKQNQIFEGPDTWDVAVGWPEGIWQEERDTAVVSIVDAPVHGGSHSLMVDSSPFQK